MFFVIVDNGFDGCVCNPFEDAKSAYKYALPHGRRAYIIKGDVVDVDEYFTVTTNENRPILFY